MPVADWTQSGEWDVLYLGGQRMPGVARVEIDLPSSLDVQKPKGGKKAVVQDKGAMPATVKIELELLPEDLPDLDSAISKVRARAKNGVQEELAIAHPNARLFGVNMVKVGRISSPMPRSGGTLTISIEAIEHVKAPKAIKKPSPKPKSEEPWDDQVQDAQRALREPPSKTGAALENFTSPDAPIGSGF